MTLSQFKNTLDEDHPLSEWPNLLQALWWDGKGHWEKAHELVQDDHSKNASWIHAFLHRREGDLGNAGYWYQMAGKPASTLSLEEEWDQLVAHFLNF